MMSALRLALLAVASLTTMATGLLTPPALPSGSVSSCGRKIVSMHLFGRGEESPSSSDNDTKKPKNFFDDMTGMFTNFDDVVDDFFYKRMGAGEQWYGKRKYNPSGDFDGKYNGMGMSDHLRIEIARVKKEEIELRKQRRLQEEEERKNRL